MNKYLRVVLILLVFLLFSCSKEADKSEDAGKDKFKNFMKFRKEAVLPVTAAVIRTGTTASVLTTSGRLESVDKVQVISRISETIISIHKDVGNFVRKGDILVELERNKLELAKKKVGFEIEQTNVSIKKAELEYTKAFRDYEKAKNIFETTKGVYTSEEVLNYKHNAEARAVDVEAQKISMKLNQLSLENAERDLGFTTIKAPISGIIVNRFIEQNEQVGVNQKLFEIENTDKLEVEIELTETEVNKIFLNQTGIILSNNGSFVYLAKVVKIAPKIDTSRGLLKITLQVINWKAWRYSGMLSNLAKLRSLSAPLPGLMPHCEFSLLGGVLQLRPGMFVEVQISLSFHKDVILVPKDALNYDQERAFVYVVNKKSRAEKRFIILESEFSTPDSIELIQGVEAGELVVIRHSDLKDGSKVQVLETK